MQLFHTYKKTKIPLKPINPPVVTMYNCGPTVYSDMTIGNIRSFVFIDTLRRALDYNGYATKQVMNITDVGHLTMTDEQKKAASPDLEITDTDAGLDRMEKAAAKEGLTVWEIAEKYITKIFGKNYSNRPDFDPASIMGKLNMLKPQFIPRASEHIQEQIDMTQTLLNHGFAYLTTNAIYFDVTKYTKYEQLTGQSFKELQTAVRTEVNEDPDKRHPADFRLWQLNQPDHAMQWDSPWGKGYPGWSIECSAMAKKYLGDTIDIHTGGVDHIKVHHANEMAQSECANNAEFANIWLHNEFTTIDGKRIGKSLGNAITIENIETKGFNALDLRYFFLLTHYRSKNNFTWKGLEAAANARKNILSKLNHPDNDNAPSNPDKVISYKTQFKDLINDDLNTPQALALLWDALKDNNLNHDDKITLALEFDQVLGLKLKEFQSTTIEIPTKITALADQRQQARIDKNWAKSDELRDEIKAAGYEIKDTENGYTISISRLNY